MSTMIIMKTVVLGIGATIALDVWSYTLALFDIKSLDYRFVGRWLRYMPEGKYFHNKIFDTPPIQHELLIGRTAHYLIGITFAFLLVGVFGEEWLTNPTFYPPIFIGIITVALPLFVMQPALGFGIASSRLPEPNIRRLKSLSTHIVYGAGLYLTGLLMKQFWN